jgi:hypothetical protein
MIDPFELGQLMAMASLCQENLYVLKEAADRVEGYEELKASIGSAKKQVDRAGSILCSENSKTKK